MWRPNRRILTCQPGRAKGCAPTVSLPLPPSSLHRLAIAIGAAVALWAAVVAATGGVSIAIAGMRLSSRSAWRPAAVALLLLAAGLWRTSAAERRRLTATAAAALDRIAPWTAGVAAVVVVVVSTIYGTHVAGAADSSGYVSQSRLWAEGRLTVAAPVVSQAPWPARGFLVAPLGYRPTPRPDELGPSYAPGLPWLMALGAGAVGDAGRYVWTPALGGLLVWGTFRLTTLVAPPAAALGAALLVAGSPPVLYQATQTMSDLPVAALWVWVLVWLQTPGWRATIGAGVVAATALAVRPNLFPAVGAVWLAALLTDRAPLPRRLADAAIRAVPLGLSAAAVAAINARLWGSPLVSGYGAASEILSTSNVVANLAAVWRWTVETRGYWTAAGLTAVVVLASRRRGRVWWTAVALVAGVFASYLPYAQFSEWWYLRFYLPVWPALAAACVAAIWGLVSRWSPAGGRVAIAAAALVVALHGASLAQAYGVFELWRGEQRYRGIGRWVDGHAGADAALLAVQHSGALNYYTRRTVVRFDEVAADDLDRLCAALAAAGRDVWLVVDDWEEPVVRARFASQARGRLDWGPIAEARVGPARVRIYDLATPTRATGPEFVPVAAGAVWPWARDRATPAQ